MHTLYAGLYKMKLLWCEKCNDLVMLRIDMVTKCSCEAYAGKYLDDNITAVVNDDAIVVGIDNNSFNNAVVSQKQIKEEYEERYDFFFCGWIPTRPGEVVFVDTVEDVHEYNESGTCTTSTMPISAE